jgi:hypothetical protein
VRATIVVVLRCGSGNFGTGAVCLTNDASAAGDADGVC